jgi:hypothetical protein
MIMTTIAVSRPISARLSSLGRSIVAALALLIPASAALADEGQRRQSRLQSRSMTRRHTGWSSRTDRWTGSASISGDEGRRSWGASYRLVPVSQMEALLQGLEHNEFDIGIGAITITPERVARVDFSYPAHRSGVAVAVRKDSGAMAAIGKYGAILAELSPLIAFTAVLLVAMVSRCGWSKGRSNRRTNPPSLRCATASIGRW